MYSIMLRDAVHMCKTIYKSNVLFISRLYSISFMDDYMYIERSMQ